MFDHLAGFVRHFNHGALLDAVGHLALDGDLHLAAFDRDDLAGSEGGGGGGQEGSDAESDEREQECGYFFLLIDWR